MGLKKMPGQTFRKAARLSSRSDFLLVKKYGRRASGQLFMLQAAKNNSSDKSRLGVITTRKTGGAVARARMRRLIREVFRRHRAQMTSGFDLVVVARPPLAKAAYHQVESEWLRLGNRLELFTPLERETPRTELGAAASEKSPGAVTQDSG